MDDEETVERILSDIDRVRAGELSTADFKALWDLRGSKSRVDAIVAEKSDRYIKTHHPILKDMSVTVGELIPEKTIRQIVDEAIEQVWKEFERDSPDRMTPTEFAERMRGLVPIA